MTRPARNPPSPLEWHPAYRGMTWLLNWLDKETSSHIRIPIWRRPSLAIYESSVGVADTLSSIVTMTMTRYRAVGPAPFVGRPFHYEWWVGIDDHGRAIAGESRIVYQEPPSRP